MNKPDGHATERVSTSVDARTAARVDPAIELHADAPAHTEASIGTHGEASTPAQTHAHIDAHTDVHTEAPIKANADAHTQAPIRAHADVHTQAPIKAHTDAHTRAPFDAHADTHNEPQESAVATHMPAPHYAPRPAAQKRGAASGATAALIALIALSIAWEWWLAPLRPGGSALVLKALPLLLALPGVWRQRLYTLQWASMLILLYFAEGIVRGWSDRGLSARLGWLEAALTLVFFVCTLAYVAPFKRAAKRAAKLRREPPGSADIST